MEKLIFPVSVTQKEQLSGVFIFDFEKSAFLAHPNGWGGGSKFKVTENQVLTVYFQFQIIHKMIKSEAGYFPTITGYSELS